MNRFTPSSIAMYPLAVLRTLNVQRTLGWTIAACALGCVSSTQHPSSAGRSATTVEETINEFAIRTWGRCSREAVEQEIAYGDAGDVGASLIPLPDARTLALVDTPCHESAGGAYNHESSVLLVDEHGMHAMHIPVALEAEEPPPTSRVCDSGEAFECMVTGASLSDVDGRVQLSTRMHFRGLGDSGWQLDFEWTGEHFRRVAVRSRVGGTAFLSGEEVGPYPIVHPLSRQCRPLLALDDSQPGQGLFTALAGVDSVSTPFNFSEEDCEDAGDSETLDCGSTSYTVISRRDDWVLLRVENHEEEVEVTEVLLRPRGCDL